MKQLSGTNGKMVKLLMENPTFKCLESEDGMVHWTKVQKIVLQSLGWFLMVSLQKLLPVGETRGRDLNGKHEIFADSQVRSTGAC